MKMNTTTLLLLLAAGGAAYFMFAKKGAPMIQQTAGLSGADAMARIEEAKAAQAIAEAGVAKAALQTDPWAPLLGGLGSGIDSLLGGVAGLF